MAPKKDSVSEFLSKVDEQEKQQRDKAAKEEADQQAYEAEVKRNFYGQPTADKEAAERRYKFQTENSMEELENPISALMAMKHPEN